MKNNIKIEEDMNYDIGRTGKSYFIPVDCQEL